MLQVLEIIFVSYLRGRKKRKICIVTGSRSEYGLLYCLMRAIRKDRTLKLQIVATGSHLSRAFGSTWRMIRQDGFQITKKVPVLSEDNSTVGVTRALGNAVSRFAAVFEFLKADILVVLGDRYEILGVVAAALIAKIPVAHIGGGDITEGAFDDAIRHAITKMSHLHFVTNTLSAKRVRQMGEDKKRVFNVGYLGLDYIKQMKQFSRSFLEKKLKLKFLRKKILVTFHPVTLDEIPSETQFQELLRALDSLDNSVLIIFTKPNADTNSLKLVKMLDRFAKGRKNVKVFTSLGQDLYLNVMRHIDAVVGNSSSGIYEAPLFHKPTVNIGDRQKGRPQVSSVINCEPQAAAIYSAIQKAFKTNCSKIKNFYGNGNAAPKILRAIKRVKNPELLLKKRFVELKSA